MADSPTQPTEPLGPEQLAALLDRCAAPLELYARGWCDTPEDVVQEAFVDLAACVPVPDDAVAWLYRVVRNKAVSAARSASRRKRRESRAARQRAAWFQDSPDESLDGHSAAAALAALPDEQREVVVARIWGGLTFEQIGRLIGSTDSTAHRRYTAALSALREKLRVPCPKTS